MANILITGGTGFVGSHLATQLLKTSSDTIHLTRFGSRPLDFEFPADQVHRIDISIGAATDNLLKKLRPTQIYHLAALAVVQDSHSNPSESILDNTQLQISFLESVKSFLPKARVLIVGSAQEYDPHALDRHRPIKESDQLGPHNPYGVSKVMQDLLALSYVYSYKLDIVRARPFNHTGPRQTPQFAVPSFAKQIAAIEAGTQAAIEVGNLDAIRDISDVSDVVAAYQILMNSGQTGEVYNVGSGQGVSMQLLLDHLIKLSHASVTVTQVPERMRPSDVPYLVADISKIKQLGWHPQVPLEQTLNNVLNYWRES